MAPKTLVMFMYKALFPLYIYRQKHQQFINDILYDLHPKIEELEGQQLVNLFLLLALPPAFDTVLEEGCENQIQQAACDLWPTQVKFIGNLTVELCDYRDFVDCAKDAIATFRVRDKRFIKFNPEHHKILYNMVEPDKFETSLWCFH